MAKKAYIGVDGIARKIKKGYVSINTEIPIYETDTITVNITASNIGTCFMVTNGTYYFKGFGSTFTTNNGGIHSSTAQTTLTALSDMDVSFNYSYSSESGFDKFTLTVAGTVVKNGVSGATTTGTYNKTLTAGQTIVFQYTKDGSANGGDDKCTFSNMIVTKQETIQIGSEFKGVARKIKKAYIGIGGVARPCWGGRELVNYGLITPLSVVRRTTSVSTGEQVFFKKVLFAGGSNVNRYYATVDAYDKSLVRTSIADLSQKRLVGAAAYNGITLFAGGNGFGRYKTVDAYDSQFVKVLVTKLEVAKTGIGATVVGDYAIFGGGFDGLSSDPYDNTVDAYSSSLIKVIAPRVTTKENKTATTIGNYGLFSGASGEVEAFDKSLTRTYVDPLSFYSLGVSAITIGNHALFGGGKDNEKDVYYEYVNAYDEHLVRTNAPNLGLARNGAGTVVLGDYALFIGGSIGYNDYTTAVDAYDKSLVRTTAPSLSRAKMGTAASINDYALFAGVLDGYECSDEVEVYTIIK